MTVPPRITLVTLGVADVARSTQFYTALGWRLTGAGNESVSFFALEGIVLGIFGRSDLAADAGVPDTPRGFGGFTLAINLGSREEVDAALRSAVAAGANLVKPAVEVFWGGYAGYFGDPDGHLWEVAHNPFWPLDERGRPLLPV
jgi:uncharacterized protein